MHIREMYADVLRLRIRVLDARLERLAAVTALRRLPFQPGDPVRLRPSYARTMGKRVNWLDRRGVVVYCNAHDATVKWSDRVTVDRYAVKALEVTR